jgi:hypothetical protein
LIDVTSGELVTHKEPTRYVALSYVWGQHIVEHLSLRKIIAMEAEGLNRHIDLKAMPRTIRDAVELARIVNEKYLWVDTYCIDQTDARDVHENIARMAAMYQNAHFTIIAADGEHADAGLTRLRANQSSVEQTVSIGNSEGRALLVRFRPPPHC